MLDTHFNRTCSLQVLHYSLDSLLTLIVANLPSTEHQLEEFQSFLQQFENSLFLIIISPVMVLGDQNAHIGDLNRGSKSIST